MKLVVTPTHQVYAVSRGLAGAFECHYVQYACGIQLVSTEGAEQAFQPISNVGYW